MSDLFHIDEVPQIASPRYVLKRGDSLVLTHGFRSKAAASDWINNLGHRLDWRVGFVFKLRGDTVNMAFVDRNGAAVKP